MPKPWLQKNSCDIIKAIAMGGIRGGCIFPNDIWSKENIRVELGFNLFSAKINRLFLPKMKLLLVLVKYQGSHNLKRR